MLIRSRRCRRVAGVHIRESVTINAPADQVYRFWRQLDRLPEVMPHLAKVEQLDTKRSRWTAKAFDQVPITWNAEIINEVPFETIGWKTLPGESIQNAGSVTFKAGARQRRHRSARAPAVRRARRQGRELAREDGSARIRQS